MAAAACEDVVMDVVDESACEGVEDQFHCFIDFRQVDIKARRRAVAQRLHLVAVDTGWAARAAAAA